MTERAYQQPETSPEPDHRLGRHVRHDERSRNFALPRGAAPTVDIRHRNWGARLDQGNLGACTGYAAAHCVNHMPLRVSRRPKPTLRNREAVAVYGMATTLDPWEGVYPPTDTGSSGLAACQSLVRQGYARGYEWAFGFQHGLTVIAQGSLMQGSWWHGAMFTPDADGRVHPRGGKVGGHEYLWLGVDVDDRRSWFLNSWGLGWGGNGKPATRGQFYMTWDDHEALLADDGDLVRPVA